MGRLDVNTTKAQQVVENQLLSLCCVWATAEMCPAD